MNNITKLLIAAALVAIPVTASADSLHYGKTASGLRLGMKKVGDTVQFHVRNVGKTDIQFVERWSCSGFSDWSLEAIKDEKDGTRVASRLVFGKSKKCKENTKVARTVAAGETVVVTIDLPADRPFDSKEGVKIRGKGTLTVRGVSGSVVLTTDPIAVETDSFP